MNTAEIELYLHEHIPLSAAMQVRVLEAGPAGVRLEAPLAPNINHRETAFGGSIASIAVLAGWALVHFGLRRENFSPRVVVQTHNVEYLLPIDGTFESFCPAPDANDWNRFLKTLRRHGRARIDLKIEVSCRKVIATTSQASFVAFA